MHDVDGLVYKPGGSKRPKVGAWKHKNQWDFGDSVQFCFRDLAGMSHKHADGSYHVGSSSMGLHAISAVCSLHQKAQAPARKHVA